MVRETTGCRKYDFRDAEAKTASAAGRIEGGQFSFQAIAGNKRVLITATRDVPGKTVVGSAR